MNAVLFSFSCAFYSSKNTKNKIVVSIKIWSSTVFNIDNNNKCFLASNQHIRMVSEGSCDTEDWSNDAENHRNELHFTIYSNRKIIFHNITVFAVVLIKQIHHWWAEETPFNSIYRLQTFFYTSKMGCKCHFKLTLISQLFLLHSSLFKCKLLLKSPAKRPHKSHMTPPNIVSKCATNSQIFLIKFFLSCYSRSFELFCVFAFLLRSFRFIILWAVMCWVWESGCLVLCRMYN